MTVHDRIRLTGLLGLCLLSHNRSSGLAPRSYTAIEVQEIPRRRDRNKDHTLQLPPRLSPVLPAFPPATAARGGGPPAATSAPATAAAAPTTAPTTAPTVAPTPAAP